MDTTIASTRMLQPGRDWCISAALPRERSPTQCADSTNPPTVFEHCGSRYQHQSPHSATKRIHQQHIPSAVQYKPSATPRSTLLNDSNLRVTPRTKLLLHLHLHLFLFRAGSNPQSITTLTSATSIRLWSSTRRPRLLRQAKQAEN